MGPNHPGWCEIGIDESPRRRLPSHLPDPGRLPTGSVPPGARFDPIIPERPLGGGGGPGSFHGIGRPRRGPLR